MQASLPDQQVARGVRWGELLLGMGFVLIPIAAVLLGNRGEASFYSQFWFAWMTYAAFAGMTFFLTPIVHDLRILRHVFVSLVILTGIGLCFLDQHFFAAPGIKNWFFNLAAIVGLIACVRANRHFPHPVRLFAVPITVITLCVALFWALASPCQIFLPVLFMPEANLAAARATFAQAFLSGMVTSILICAAIRLLGSRWSAPPDRFAFLEQPISRKTKIRMIQALVALLAAGIPTLYFIPGTSSGSGSIPVQFLFKDLPEQDRVSVDEVERHLREIGLKPSDGRDFSLRPQGTPVAWYCYPLSKSRTVELCLWRDPEKDEALFISYRYSKVSLFESRKIRDMMATLHRHFLDLTISRRKDRVSDWQTPAGRHFFQLQCGDDRPGRTI